MLTFDIINKIFSLIFLRRIHQQGNALKTNENENHGLSESVYFVITKITK